MCAKAGEQTSLNAPCAMCRTVRGTSAGGAVAPDLSHIASRTLASDVYPNDTADLKARIAHTQSLKPGCKMPDLPQFSRIQPHELLAYLRQLK